MTQTSAAAALMALVPAQVPGDNGDLRHNAGNARNLCGQAGVGVEQIKTALKLGTRGIIERNDRCTGLGGHLQHADIVFRYPARRQGEPSSNTTEAFWPLHSRKQHSLRRR